MKAALKTLPLVAFISLPNDGVIYIAERRLGRRMKLQWSAMPERGCGDSLIDARYVPTTVRRAAKKFFGRAI